MKRALAAAVVAHASILAAVFLVPPARRQAPPPAAEPVAIEVIEARDEGARVEPAREAPVAEADPAQPDRGAIASVANRDTSRDQDRERGRAPSGGPNQEPVVPAPVAPPTPEFVRPDPAAIGLALGGPNRFVTREAPAAPSRSPGAPAETPYGRPQTPAEAKRAVDAALRAPARQRERDLGLGPEGPVLAALGEAASASTAPVHGRAVFLAIADGTGMIVGIDVVECDGARSGWANAAALANTALKGKKLRMPSSATRAEMRIEITSDWKMPSGHDPGADVSVFGVPVAKGEGKQSTKVSILDPLPKIRVVELAPDVKVPIPVIGVDVLAVQGDPANIGAKPRRIVHTRLLDSKVL